MYKREAFLHSRPFFDVAIRVRHEADLERKRPPYHSFALCELGLQVPQASLLSVCLAGPRCEQGFFSMPLRFRVRLGTPLRCRNLFSDRPLLPHPSHSLLLSSVVVVVQVEVVELDHIDRQELAGHANDGPRNDHHYHDGGETVGRVPYGHDVVVLSELSTKDAIVNGMNARRG